MKLDKFLLVIISIFLIDTTSQAQGYHYWDNQYSAVATAMGGTTMSFVDDNSSVYYNPGALAFIHPTSISVTANAYRLDNVNITNGAGSNLDLNSRRVSMFPSMVGGVVKFGEKDNHNWDFGYAVIQRYHEDVKINTRHEMEYDAIDSPDAPGDERYIGGFEYENLLNELWGGFAIAYKANDKFGVGLSTFGTYRNHNSNMNIFTRAVPNWTIDGNYNYASGNSFYDFTYNTVGLLWKLGLSYRVKKIHYGLTFTTPSVHLYGKGDVQREVSGTDIIRLNIQDKATFLGVDRQEDIDAVFKNPTSVSVGASWVGDVSIISFALEHFRQLKNFSVLSPDSNTFVQSASNDDLDRFNSTEFLSIEYEAKPVTNFGIGYSYQFSEKLRIKTGVRTDFSSAMKPRRNATIKIGQDHWNTTHLSLGFELVRKTNEFSLAVDFGFGKAKNNWQFINFTDPKDTFFSPQYQIKMVGERDQTAQHKITSINLTLGLKQFVNKKEETDKI